MTSTVQDVMTSNVVALRKEAQFKEIVRAMRRRHFSALPVLDSAGNVVGVVSEADLLLKEAYPASPEDGGGAPRRRDRAKAAALTAADLMTSPAITIAPDAGVTEAARLMHKSRVKRLPVVTPAGGLVGIVSRIDVLGLYDRKDDDIRDEILDDVIAEDFLLDPGSFDVQVAAGVVTIRGATQKAAIARSLLDVIWHVAGVVDVRDRLSCQGER